MFKFRNSKVAQLYFKLFETLTGEEPCAQPEFLEDPENFSGDITADKYTGNWTGSSLVKPETAQELCAGCPVLELCRDYATEAQEPYGIWGGTRPVDRGIVGVIRSGKLWEEEDDD